MQPRLGLNFRRFAKGECMASIYQEILVKAPPQFVWEAVKDVGALHTRLARGFVTGTVLQGDTRTVTFANGFVVREQIVSIDDTLRRLAYRAVGGRASHHNASVQVFAAADAGAKVVWITDLLPDEMRAPIAQMVEAGAAAMQRTLEESFHP
jgi:hypothetical protein